MKVALNSATLAYERASSARDPKRPGPVPDHMRHRTSLIVYVYDVHASPPLSSHALFIGFCDWVGVTTLCLTRHDSLTKSSTRCALGHLESLRPRRTTPRAKSTS